MTVHDIVTAKLKEMGADGLVLCYTCGKVLCSCRMDEADFLRDFDCELCVPARLVNGELVPMEETS